MRRARSVELQLDHVIRYHLQFRKTGGRGLGTQTDCFEIHEFTLSREVDTETEQILVGIYWVFCKFALVDGTFELSEQLGPFEIFIFPFVIR